ncbi:hypothetical protein AB2L27_19780 [Kineococcus sp. LSe6-4]|uniref:Uncharacterized protein n=1 Tax=Kineococcus halophytocola TaxID=3234027 RepID=A0ABV4H991_9ACTN
MTVIADLTRQAIVAELTRYKRGDLAIEVWTAGHPRAHVGRVNHVDEQLLVLTDARSSLITLVLDHVIGWTFASAESTKEQQTPTPMRRAGRWFSRR